MKTNKHSLIYAILPLFAPLSAIAESEVSKVTDVKAAKASGLPSPGSKSRSNSWRASEIIGTNVKNAQDETVGEIKDLIVEWSTQEVIGVVISTGGFLGVADSLNSVALSSLKYDSAGMIFRTTLTKADLKKETGFTSTTWPDFDEEEATTALRAARNKVGGDVTAPDNTAQNEKDIKEDTATPLDQGNSESDLQITKNIRSSVVGAELSFNAKNIKIITHGGKVTLRGVVESREEHEAVLKLVHNHADASKVTDELKVNTK